MKKNLWFSLFVHINRFEICLISIYFAPCSRLLNNCIYLSKKKTVFLINTIFWCFYQVFTLLWSIRNRYEWLVNKYDFSLSIQREEKIQSICVTRTESDLFSRLNCHLTKMKHRFSFFSWFGPGISNESKWIESSAANKMR